MTTEPVLVDLLVHGGHVVTASADWQVHPDGAVAIADGRIVAVGPTAGIRAAVRARETLDAAGCLVVPGLIDAHLHPGYAITARLTVKSDWTRPGPFALGGDIAAFLAGYGRIDRARVSEEESYAAARLALLSALKSGTTCWSDGSVGDADGIARASLDLGLRGIVTIPAPRTSPSNRAAQTPSRSVPTMSMHCSAGPKRRSADGTARAAEGCAPGTCWRRTSSAATS